MVFMEPLVLKLTCFPVSGICNLSLPPLPFIIHAHIHVFHRHYVEVVGSYISLEEKFLNFVTQIRAEYDPWLNQAGVEDKLSAVSLQGTLADTLKEVRRCWTSPEMLH